jgi:starch synthase (maltosyl-transferring)
MPLPRTAAQPSRIQIQRVEPVIDCDRFAPKRTVGESVGVRADIFRDGHEVLRAVVRYRPPGERRWGEAPMERIDAHLGGDRWAGAFAVTSLGRWQFTIEAWRDAFASWRDELARKAAAGQEELDGELSEGAVLLEQAAARAKGTDKAAVAAAHETVADTARPTDERVDAALDEALFLAIERFPDRSEAATLPQPYEVDVDPERARFGSWYELFPRSWGGLSGVTEVLPQLATLGFDVLYLPPVHPIGETNRKGKNNALTAGPGDPGSPWAIGTSEGGHTALHPELGTFEDFDAMTARARELGIDVALDFAIQCSPDHPWLTEHPEWFNRRPDGTLKYAENPPKKYQDIYNVNFDTEDWRGLWEALRDVLLFWVDHGVTAFRVDNPHTKALPFWEWAIREVRDAHPEVIFLAEAFTRATMMRGLAKLGFNQSYTYFTWKNGRHELTEYIQELAYSGMEQYYRPNFFVNTPDILHAYLQRGGPAAFMIRLVLGATLSPTYGVYSGFEHFENVPVREGSEEYLDSEKYEVKQRRLDGPLLGVIGRINAIRRQNPALQHLDNVAFLDTRNDDLIAFAKRTGDNVIIVAATLDPHAFQEGVAAVPAALGLPPAFTVEDLLTGERWPWRIGLNYLGFHPAQRVAHVFRVEP